jgi:hypothetical protein
MYIQRGGAPPRVSRVVIQHLNNTFPGRWIGRGGQINWPPMSPDLTPLDYGLWEWMENQVYESKLNTRDALLARILDAAARIKECYDQVRENKMRYSQGSCKVHSG